MAERPAHTFPFTAVVDQHLLKTALLLNAVDPGVGGVLIRGEKGTAKSTVVRALAVVLPDMDVVEGCRFSCDPSDPKLWCADCCESHTVDSVVTSLRKPWIVDLPVSTTEDRLVGTLDLEHALKHGERKFEPGILAKANRSILYVDEVNLLDDHLVDTLLDASAMGVNTVEREGVSFRHPARFILVGTMNPEEGEVRPQLTDRFGLCVDVRGVKDPVLRMEIMDRRQRFDEDPSSFIRAWVDSEDELRVRLAHARLRLPTVELTDEIKRLIVSICIEADVDGHRADLVMARAAAARTSLEGRTLVEHQDVLAVASMVLLHRIRKAPFANAESAESIVKELLSAFSTTPSSASCSDTDNAEKRCDKNDAGDGLRPGTTATRYLGETASESLPLIEKGVLRELDAVRRAVSGRRHESISSDSKGRHIRSVKAATTTLADVAIDATFRSAAPYQLEREGDLAINIDPADIMSKVRKRKTGASIVLCVDASGSMGAADRMEAARGAVLGLLKDAYQRRDRVGLVTFRGEGADIIMLPTASVELAQLKLKSMPTGGATPLAAGLLKALELLENETRRDAEVIPWLVLVTDGRANVGLNGGLGSEDARAAGVRVRSAKINTIVFDTGTGPKATSGAREIARIVGGEYLRLTDLDGRVIKEAMRTRL